MERFTVKKEVQDELKNGQPFDLMDKVRESLMTPDIQAAIAAGCNVEVFTQQTKTGYTIHMRTKEKVSILRHPSGTIVHILIEPKK